ncbi:MAG: PDZ domain-containing protein [Thermoleophilia bacterium]|nr:PDZ domain-containing protein [Thermoleophilia bacterium]
MPRPSPGPLAVVGALLLLVVLAASWLFPSGDYLYVPNEAQPLRDRVSVGDRPDDDTRGGIFYVDVTVRRARWAEVLVPFLRPEGATLVAGDQVEAHGNSSERRRQAQADMDRSERIAAAVALRAAGLQVTIRPRGVRVDAVLIDVPAATTLREGDVIIAAAGRPTLSPDALLQAVRSVQPGDEIRLRVRRDARTFERAVRTVTAPGEPDRPVIGIQVSADVAIRLPLEVKIDLGGVGGPSAGLAFALEVLQELGRDLDRGYRVAATGEVELDGSVSAVGGLEQKTIGARRAGIDLFIVPSGDNAAVARRFAGTMRVVPVDTYQQALSALATLTEI